MWRLGVGLSANSQVALYQQELYTAADQLWHQCGCVLRCVNTAQPDSTAALCCEFYPIPEGTSSGLLNASSEVFGVLFTLTGGEILDAYGDMVTNCTMTAMLLAGLAMTTLIQGTALKRQAAVAVKCMHTHLEQEEVQTTQT